MLTKAYLLTAIICVVLVGCTISSRHNGLFNNLNDSKAAVTAHRGALNQTFVSGSSWSKLNDVVKQYGGACAQLSKFPPYNSLDQQRYSCEVSVEGRFPLSMGFSYRWIMIVVKNKNNFTVEYIKRARFGF